MGNINLSFDKPKTKKTNIKNSEHRQKVILTYHPEIIGRNEYYTYLNADNEEVKLIDNSYKVYPISANKIIGKRVQVNKVMLDFVPSKDNQEYVPAYFTYNGGSEVYLDDPIKNEENNSYHGILHRSKVYDKEVKLFEY